MAEKKTVYSDTEKLIVEALEQHKDEELTLAELSEIVGRKLTSGNINALVNKKGNVACTPENREVQVITTKKVATYRFVKGIE